MNDNFFNNSAFNGMGMVSGFRDGGGHTSTFESGFGNHVTFDKPFNALGHRRDFSLETSVRLDGFNHGGGLERRLSAFDAIDHSPFKPTW